MKTTLEKTERNNYKQWIADVYHCSGTWGERITPEDMLITLIETKKQSFPGDYVPACTFSMSVKCSEYWNQLCKMYPN